METIIIFLLSFIINLNDFDKYRISAFVSKENKSFVKYIEDKKLYYSSFNYKFQNTTIHKIIVPTISLNEIRFSTYVPFRTIHINYYKSNCSLKNCEFFFDNFNNKNLNIEIISTTVLKEKIDIILSENYISSNNLNSNNLNPNNLNSNNLNIRQFKLFNFYEEIKKEQGVDILLLQELEKITKYNNTNKIEINEFLAKKINKKKYKTAYINYKDDKYYLISKFHFNKYKDSESILIISNISDYVSKNSNLKNLKLDYIFDKIKLNLNFFADILFNKEISGINYYSKYIIFFPLIPLFFVFNKNLINLYKNRIFYLLFFFYLLVLDTIILNYFSIIFIFIIFFIKKKYSKHV
jgi:hypothetical protein